MNMGIYLSGLQGVEQAQGLFERSAARIAQAGAKSDSVDLSQTAVSLLSAINQFGLGLDLIKVADEMQKSAINILA
jgi:hypothetical protein